MPPKFLLPLLLTTSPAPAIELVLDFTLDEQNYNWCNPATTDGLARRHTLQSAAGFLSAIIRDDDWNALTSFNKSFSISDVSENVLNNIAGTPVAGTAEGDGAGYSYSFSTTNRSSLGANQIVIYIGAFHFDPDTTTGRRKFLTKLDAAALRDLGYDVADSWSEVAPTYNLTITPDSGAAKLDWTATRTDGYFVEWSADFQSWTSLPLGTTTTWTDPVPFGTKRFYRVSD